MEASWLSIILSMLEDIIDQYQIVKSLITNVLVDWVLKGLSSLHVTLWLLRDMCCPDKVSLPQSVRQW